MALLGLYARPPSVANKTETRIPRSTWDGGHRIFLRDQYIRSAQMRVGARRRFVGCSAAVQPALTKRPAGLVQTRSSASPHRRLVSHTGSRTPPAGRTLNGHGSDDIATGR